MPIESNQDLKMSDKKKDTTHNKDKRDFFRVSQDLIFDFKPADTYSAENETAESEFEDSVSLSLIKELKRLDRDNVQTLRLLTEKNRLLGDYLQSLSSKIDLIARHSLFAQESATQNKTRINLSEDGLAFISERAIYKDSYVAVRLIFLPSYSPVMTFAKVLRCEPREERYQVAAKFHRLDENDRQELSKQIMRAQVNNRRTQKS